MDAQAAGGWGMAVRVLALIAAVLAVSATLEGRAIRRLRAELQVARTEREEARAGLTSAWARQSGADVREAIRALNGFYADPVEGFARPGGVCADGRVDDDAIARFAFGAFLPARAQGRSTADSIDAMTLAIRRSEAYRSIHPELAEPR
jgi:hypothetical protein